MASGFVLKMAWPACTCEHPKSQAACCNTAAVFRHALHELSLPSTYLLGRLPIPPAVGLVDKPWNTAIAFLPPSSTSSSDGDDGAAGGSGDVAGAAGTRLLVGTGYHKVRAALGGLTALQCTRIQPCYAWGPSAGCAVPQLGCTLPAVHGTRTNSSAASRRWFFAGAALRLCGRQAATDGTELG